MKKNPQKFCIGTANALCFTFKRKVQRNANSGF
jgi:hypothetical protein